MPDTEPWPGEEAIAERYSPEALRVHAILREWFTALESDKAQYWQPDPRGRTWTEAELEAYVTELDDYVGATAQMHYANNPGRLMGSPAFDAGPGFSRLAYPQRLAMAQQLAKALEPTDAEQTKEESN